MKVVLMDGDGWYYSETNRDRYDTWCPVEDISKATIFEIELGDDGLVSKPNLKYIHGTWELIPVTVKIEHA